nr:TolC family outer membrane protein [Cohaesibacter haloalkalitolerans]
MLLMATSSSEAISLKEAISTALTSNPTIGESMESREAIEFELRQAKGLYLPSVDLEASSGARSLDNPSRRSSGLDNDPLYPSEVSLVLTQKLYDGGRTRAEIDRQASRVDSASFRVLERSESVGLQIVREYLEYMLQAEIVAQSNENLRVHQSIASSISKSIQNGTLTEADRQQVSERIYAARAKVEQAKEALAAADIQFRKLVGTSIARPQMPKSVAYALPKSLNEAIDLGLRSNPRISVANADVDAADSLVDAAKADFLPEVVFEGRARTGHDLDGADGRTTDFQARVVARWNLYRGGIKLANEREQIRRSGEQRMIRSQAHRDVEEAVRTSWDRRIRQNNLAQIYRSQANENNRLVGSYRKQFDIGQRSLLDVLDAQNTRFNVDVLSKTAVYASRFAEYRLLAATGQLLNTLDLAAPAQSEAYARDEFKSRRNETRKEYKRAPSRQVNDFPLDILSPIRRD